VIAEIMGCEEEHVSRIIRRDVDRAAATKEIIRQLNERRTQRAKPPAKPSVRNALSAGAGDGNRTHDIQLGKLSFYH
jgi:hypothetical protein